MELGLIGCQARISQAYGMFAPMRCDPRKLTKTTAAGESGRWR